MKKVLITTAAVLSFATAAMAFEQGMDTDGDGVLNFNEMLAAFPELTQENFTAIDTDEDGVINTAEWMAAKDAGILK
ncbi:MAG: EF-hand domain-containing protein [Rhodobacteraceae bacterium]|nr:EF-hand domain-containing protein [Paracoccaceae bacterium]